MDAMVAYVLEAEVGSFGYLSGGDDLLPADPVTHRWDEPYPVVRERLRFSWDPGELGRKPNFYQHNLLRDLVCDRPAYQVLAEVAGEDLRVVARGDLDGEEMVVVQATAVLDVLDEQRSLPSEYSWARFSWPHVRDDALADLDRRVFRLPYRELSLLVLAGAAVAAAIESAGLSGLSFSPARVDE
jgi:hypothetical protein